MFDKATYLNSSGIVVTRIMQIDAHATYIIDLNQLNGLHILNRAMKPTAVIAIEDIVTTTSLVTFVNI